jgi:hypothetical protein
MRHFGRKILITSLVILPFFLCWVTTMAVPAYLTHLDTPPGTDFPANTDASVFEPMTLILLGAGLLNLAIWGRNHCRNGSTKSGVSV